MENKELLEKLIPAINNIDNGCSSCISEFVRNVNPRIKESGLRLQMYQVDEYNIKVRVVEKSVPMTEEEKEDAYLSGDYNLNDDE